MASVCSFWTYDVQHNIALIEGAKILQQRFFHLHNPEPFLVLVV